MTKENYDQQPLMNEIGDLDGETFGSDPGSDRVHHGHGLKLHNYIYRLFVISLVLIIVVTSSVFIGIRIQAQRSVDQICAAHTTLWSPILRDVSIEYRPHKFEGSFMNENIYRQKGSPAVDAAWEELGVDCMNTPVTEYIGVVDHLKDRAGIISKEDGLLSGLEPSFVQRAGKYGGGFLVNVEGMHHLHCVNLLRKSLYFNYEYYKLLGQHAFRNEEPILRRHVTHCLDTIRQVMMCNVDTGVLGQVWVDPNDPIAFPDFNTKHVCKNYESIRKWAEKIQAPPYNQTPGDFLEPPMSEHILPVVP